MKLAMKALSWQGISLLGISQSTSVQNLKRYKVYNQIVAISLVTYLFFIPVAGFLESIFYFNILIGSILLLAVCLWLNVKSRFVLSMVFFMLTLVSSISILSIYLGENTGVYLCLIPISILPILFVRDSRLAYISLVGCVLIYLGLHAAWNEVTPFLLEEGKRTVLLYCNVVGIVLVSYLYNEFFRVSADENDARNMFINREISLRNEKILENVKLARQIQSNLLPSQKFMNKTFPRAFVIYEPRDIVSGDFYWIDEKDGKQYCAVIDCTGHGIPGAFVSILGHQALQRSINNFGLREPSQILNKLHELIYATLRKEDSNIIDGMDMSLICIDKKNKKMSFSGANNNILLVRDMEMPIDGMEPEFRGISRLMYKMNAQRQSVGSEYLKEAFTQIEVEIKKNDTVYIYTDGYIDQFGGPHFRKLMHTPLKKLIMEIQGQELEDQNNAIQMYFDNWRGEGKQVDDVCVVGIRVL
jgi:hypothetical protein